MNRVSSFSKFQRGTEDSLKNCRELFGAALVDP